MRVEEDAFLRHLGQTVEDEHPVLQVVEEPEEEDVVEAFARGQTVGVDVFVHDIDLDLELREDEPRLLDEHVGRLDHHAPAGPALLHLQGEVARVPADVEEGLAFQVVREVRLDELPAVVRVVSGRLPVAGPDTARKLEVVVPPAELLDPALNVFLGLAWSPAPEHAA